jgi:tetratricopeptide (TPR) repeat protein
MRVAPWARALGACAVFGLAAAAGAGNPRSVHDARGEALRLYREGHYAEALPLFDEVLRHKPHDIDALNKRGCIYLRFNEPARAIPDFNQALRYSPFLNVDNWGAFQRQVIPNTPFLEGPTVREPYVALQFYAPAFTNRGIALMMLGRDDEALADFQRSIANHLAFGGWGPGLACASCGVGQVWLRKGDPNRALDAFDRAVRYNPSDPNAFVGRGEAYEMLGALDRALADYDGAIRLDPSHPRAHAFRAVALARLGRDREATADLDATAGLDPNVPANQRLRGALLSKLGRHDQAVGAFDEAVGLDPTSAEAYKDRGGARNRAGDYAGALRDLDEAIRLDPASSKAFQNRAASFNGLGRYALAERDCDEALRLDPRNAGALNNRGLARIGLGRYGPAVDDLTEAIRLRPGMASAYLNRGGALAQLGRHEESAADYAAAVRLEPGLALAATGGSPGAGVPRDLLRVAVKPADDGPDSRGMASGVEAFCARGNERRAEGDWTGAVAEFTRAIEADPKSADGYALRGWSRLCAGAPGADADARAWLGLATWRDPFAPFMALLGALAARRDGRDLAADAFLDEALANTRPGWPAPLFRYLKGQTTAADLVAAAGDDPAREAEARAVIGFDLFGRGDRPVALDHLRWVLDHGTDRSMAKDLARATLHRAVAAGR